MSALAQAILLVERETGQTYPDFDAQASELFHALERVARHRELLISKLELIAADAQLFANELRETGVEWERRVGKERIVNLIVKRAEALAWLRLELQTNIARKNELLATVREGGA